MSATSTSKTNIQQRELSAALGRSLRKCRFATSCVTVLKYVRIQGKRAQIQVRVTKDKEDWFNIKDAGIKCS